MLKTQFHLYTVVKFLRGVYIYRKWNPMDVYIPLLLLVVIKKFAVENNSHVVYIYERLLSLAFSLITA